MSIDLWTAARWIGIAAVGVSVYLAHRSTAAAIHELADDVRLLAAQRGRVVDYWSVYENAQRDILGDEDGR